MLNHFQTLNLMQQNTTQEKPGFWSVKVGHKTVSNIVRIAPGVYGTTINCQQHPTFMKALASLIEHYQVMQQQVKKTSLVKVVTKSAGVIALCLTSLFAHAQQVESQHYISDIDGETCTITLDNDSSYDVDCDDIEEQPLDSGDFVRLMVRDGVTVIYDETTGARLMCR